MPAFELQSIMDLLVQCRLEPTLRQVFLEGSSDVAYYQWLFADLVDDPMAFQPINNVNIPAGIVEKHRQRNDNHGRLVALGLELRSRDPSSSKTVRCFPDGEYDFALQTTIAADTIVYLDSTSPEALSLNPDTLQKFRAIYLSGDAPTPTELIACVEPLLRFLFAARTANVANGWALSWPTVKVRIEGNGVACVDRREFMRAYSASGATLLSPDRLEAAIEGILEATSKLPLEQAVRGHDIGLVLGAAIRPYLRKEYKDAFKADLCEAIVRACADRSTILARKCFVAISDFLKS